MVRSRSKGRRHRSRPRGRRRRQGRQRPSRHGDQPRAGRLPAVPEPDAARSDRSALAGARPLRAVRRSLVPDAVHPALPRRVRARARGPRGAAHVGLEDPRAPRVSAHDGRRDDDRTARPGHRELGRHGDGGAPRARVVRPRRRARDQPVRPLDLRSRLRRRSAGGRLERGVVHRWHAGARQPHGDLGRQPHLHRGRHRHRVHGGRDGPVRGLRLARPVRGLDPRRRGVRREHRRLERCPRRG